MQFENSSLFSSMSSSSFFSSITNRIINNSSDFVSTTFRRREIFEIRKKSESDNIAKRRRDARERRNKIARRDRNKNKKIIDYSTLLMIFHLSQKISTTLFFFSKKLVKIWKVFKCRRSLCDDDNKFNQ
jgi:hypothetical protein